jgi:hypothetical protein
MASGRSGTTQGKVDSRFQHSTSSINKEIADVAESIVALNAIEALSDEELLKPSKDIIKNQQKNRSSNMSWALLMAYC